MTGDSGRENTGGALGAFFAEFTDATGWRWGGCQLIERIEEWAKRWPNDVEHAGCDDAVFASSGLWLIRHRGDDGANQGTTVIYVPQCTGAPPTQFHLYPDEATELIAALQRTLRPAP